MSSVGTLGGIVPSGPNSLKVKRQDFPCDGSTRPWLKQPLQPACLAQRTIMGLEPRVQLHVAGGSENFLVDTGATYCVLTSYSEAFSSQTCTILGATEKKKKKKKITKIFTRALLCCWCGQIFSHQFLVVPIIGSYYWSLIGKRSFPAFKSCRYCSPDRRCFKTLSWGQTDYFSQPASETTPEWEKPFMDV